MGRRGNICRRSAVKKGWALAATPEKTGAPPCSTLRAMDCTAGTFRRSANTLPVADGVSGCTKRGKTRSERPERQVRRGEWPAAVPECGSGYPAKLKFLSPPDALKQRDELRPP